MLKILVIFSIVKAFAAGGDLMNNGGGLAEQNFVYAFQNLPDYVDRCLDMDNPCRLIEKERRILAAVSSERKDLAGNNGLFFKSGRLNPGLFEVDEHGKPRVAVTGSVRGSPIYINLDLIYEGEGEDVALIDVPGAISILVHELGHHAGEPDHLFLDQLGNKVRGFREQFLERIDFARYRHPELRVTAHNHGPSIEDRSWGFPPTKLVLENGAALLDLTAEFEKVGTCSAGFRDSVYYGNMTWHRIAPYDVAANRQTFTFSLDMDFTCKSGRDTVVESKRIEWTGSFKLMRRLNNGEFADIADGKHWKIEDGVVFFVDSQSLRVVP